MRGWGAILVSAAVHRLSHGSITNASWLTARDYETPLTERHISISEKSRGGNGCILESMK